MLMLQDLILHSALALFLFFAQSFYLLICLIQNVYLILETRASTFNLFYVQ